MAAWRVLLDYRLTMVQAQERKRSPPPDPRSKNHGARILSARTSMYAVHTWDNNAEMYADNGWLFVPRRKYAAQYHDHEMEQAHFVEHDGGTTWDDLVNNLLRKKIPFNKSITWSSQMWYFEHRAAKKQTIRVSLSRTLIQNNQPINQSTNQWTDKSNN